MVFLYVLIVRQDIVALVFISHSFVLLIPIQVGVGFNFGMFDRNLRYQLDDFLIFRAMQVGGNGNAVRIFSSVEISTLEN